MPYDDRVIQNVRRCIRRTTPLSTGLTHPFAFFNVGRATSGTRKFLKATSDTGSRSE